MKRKNKVRRRPRSEEIVSPNIGDADAVIQPLVQRTHTAIPESDREVSQALTRHLHDLLNTLWAAAIQIEVACIEKSCPEEFHDTLERVRSHILEAMEIASRTSSLIDSTPANSLVDSRARHIDPA